MERITTITSQCFFENRNEEQEVIDKKTAAAFSNILKDCIVMTVIVMIGAVLTLLLG